MRVLKFVTKIILFLIVTISLLCAGSWYYFTGKIVSDINDNYAGKKLEILGPKEVKYTVSFDKVTSYGFPFEIAFKVHSWKEETKDGETSYKEPITVGYNLILGHLFASYEGEIEALFKPIKHNFGAKVNLKGYSLTLSVPFSKSLFTTLSSMKDPFELINHIGTFKVSAKKAEIFDLVDGEKFYDKEYESLQASFVSDHKYTSMNDFLRNIPSGYQIDYTLKSSDTKTLKRQLPITLFYSFSMLPSGFDVSANIDIKTPAKEFAKMNKAFDLNAKIKLSDGNFEIPSSKFAYKVNGVNSKILLDSNLRLENGFFDRLFDSYKTTSPYIQKMTGGAMIDREIKYIIHNKDVFKFKDLENVIYNINLDLTSASKDGNMKGNVNNFSIFSKDTGFRLKQESNSNERNPNIWDVKGLLLLQNYPAIVDFSSGYIYRFGKFKFLNDEARKLYVDVNKAFLRKISDHPESSSNDISFEYSAESTKLFDSKIGNASVSQMAAIYQSILYSSLLGKVGLEGDVLERMKKIIPDLDTNSKILQQILPGGSVDNKIVEKTVNKAIEKGLNKILPGASNESDEQNGDDKKIDVKNLGKSLLKSLGQ